MKFKRCPFCGEEPLISTYYLECDCEANPKIELSSLEIDKAMCIWNTRHTPEVDALVKALEDILDIKHGCEFENARKALTDYRKVK